MGFFSAKDKAILNQIEKYKSLFQSRNLSKEEQIAIHRAKRKLIIYKQKLTKYLGNLARQLRIPGLKINIFDINRSLSDTLKVFKMFRHALMNLHIPFMPTFGVKLSRNEMRLWYLIYRRKIFLRDMEFERLHKYQNSLQQKQLNRQIAKYNIKDRKPSLSLDSISKTRFNNDNVSNKSSNVDENIEHYKHRFRELRKRVENSNNPYLNK